MQEQECYEEITWIEDPEAWDEAEDMGDSPRWIAGPVKINELSLILADAFIGRRGQK